MSNRVQKIRSKKNPANRRRAINQKKKFAQQKSSPYLVMFKSWGKDDYPSLKELYDRYNNRYHSQQDKENGDKDNQQQKQKKQQLSLYHLSRSLNEESFNTHTLCNAVYLVDWSIPFEIFPAGELATATTAIIEKQEEEEERRRDRRDNRQLVCKRCIMALADLTYGLLQHRQKTTKRS
ncbi:MAG: hypothetical protein M3261_08430 [Thermoproteota archaeon]|nr:hypothetical protein [Thermoproteota archaeon]